MTMAYSNLHCPAIYNPFAALSCLQERRGSEHTETKAACLVSSSSYSVLGTDYPPELKVQTNTRPEPSRDMCGSMFAYEAEVTFLFFSFSFSG